MIPRHILLVDDEPVILRTLAIALRNAGHEVTVASSGTEALERLAATPYDAVLTDIAMAGMNGLDLLACAKAADPDVCVILMTGYCDVSTAIAALRAGAEDYLPKPFDYDEILLRLSRCLERRDLHRKLRLYETILPLCAGCKKVRDDAGREPGTGEWMPLEEYLERRAGVTVSHGYCPGCAEEYSR